MVADNSASDDGRGQRPDPQFAHDVRQKIFALVRAHTDAARAAIRPSSTLQDVLALRTHSFGAFIISKQVYDALLAQMGAAPQPDSWVLVDMTSQTLHFAQGDAALAWLKPPA